jgi:FkbM family methyltransferase
MSTEHPGKDHLPKSLKNDAPNAHVASQQSAQSRKMLRKLKILVGGPLVKIMRRFPGALGAYGERKYRGYLRHFTSAEFKAVLSELGPETICIDLGANIGAVTRQLSYHAGHVLAFEPDPWTFAKLRQNSIDLQNVELLQKAVGATNGTVNLFRSQSFDENPEWKSQGTSIFAAKRGADPENHFEVEMVDIVDVILGLSQEVAVLKIDIEGAEVPLLERLLDSDAAKMVKYIFVETHEYMIPELFDRTNALRTRVRTLKRPRVNMDWH